MRPALGQTKVDKILTDFSIAYRNENYIGQSILKPVNVKQRTGKYAKYGKDSWRVDTSIVRAIGAAAKEMDYTVSQGSYSCEEHALKKLVPWELQENSDDPYDPKRDATEFLLDRIWLNQENALATVMSDTAQLTLNTTLSGTDQWSDYANSDPMANFRTARAAIKAATGKTPNTAIFGWQTFDVLRDHPDVVDRVKYVGSTDIEAVKRAIAQLLNVKDVLIGDAMKNTANEGQSDSLSYVWGKHAWLAYIPERPSLMQAAFGYTMVIPSENRVVDSWVDEDRKGDFIRCTDTFGQTLIDVNLAYLIKNAVA